MFLFPLEFCQHETPKSRKPQEKHAKPPKCLFEITGPDPPCARPAQSRNRDRLRQLLQVFCIESFLLLLVRHLLLEAMHLFLVAYLLLKAIQNTFSFLVCCVISVGINLGVSREGNVAPTGASPKSKSRIQNPFCHSENSWKCGAKEITQCIS